MEAQQAILQATRDLEKVFSNENATAGGLLDALSFLLLLFRYSSWATFRNLELEVALVCKVTKMVTSKVSAVDSHHGKTLFCLQALTMYYCLLNKSTFDATMKFLRDNLNLEHISSTFRVHLRLDQNSPHLKVTQLASAVKLISLHNIDLVYRCCQHFMRFLVNNLEQYCSVIESVLNYISLGCVNEVVGVDSLHQLTKLLVSDDHKDAVSILVSNLDFFSIYEAKRLNLGNFAVTCLDDIAALTLENFMPEYWCCLPESKILNSHIEIHSDSKFTQPRGDSANLKPALEVIFEILDQTTVVSDTESVAVFFQLSESLSQILAFAYIPEAQSVIYKSFNETKCRSSLGVVLMLLSVVLSDKILETLGLDKVVFPPTVQTVFASTKLPPLPKPSFFFNKIECTDPYGLSANLLLEAVILCLTKLLELISKFGVHELWALLDKFDGPTNRALIQEFLKLFLASHLLALYTLDRSELANMNINIELSKEMAIDSSKQLLSKNEEQMEPEYLWVSFIKMGQNFCFSDLLLTKTFLFLFNGLVQHMEGADVLKSASVKATLTEVFEGLDTNLSCLSALREYTGVQASPSKNMVNLPSESYKFLMPNQSKMSSADAAAGSNRSSTSDTTRTSKSTNLTRQQSIHVDQFNKYSM